MCAEQKGRTIHLLKQSSKPVPQERKRRKIELKGTFQQFVQMQEEQKREENEAEAAAGEQFRADQNAAINNNKAAAIN